MPEKILIVDDEKQFRESTKRLLLRKGYHAEAAGSGTEALEKIGKESFDLMLVDIRMPEMNGLEMLQRAKKMAPEIMALIITGYGTDKLEKEAMQLEVDGFVNKPITIDALTKIIDETLARRGRGEKQGH